MNLTPGDNSGKHINNGRAIDGGVLINPLSVRVLRLTLCSVLRGSSLPLNVLLTLKSLVCIKLHTRQIRRAVSGGLNHGGIHGAGFTAEGETLRPGLCAIPLEKPTPPEPPFRPDKATGNTVPPCHYTSLRRYRGARAEGEDLAACQLLDLI